MLKVNTSNGNTTRIDLKDPEQAKEWLKQIKNPNFQSQITALSLTHKNVQYSLTKPKGFNGVFYFAELVPPDAQRKIKGGERIIAFMGEIRLALMAHHSQCALRVSVARVGRQRFNPFA